MNQANDTPRLTVQFDPLVGDLQPGADYPLNVRVFDAASGKSITGCHGFLRMIYDHPLPGVLIHQRPSVITSTPFDIGSVGEYSIHLTAPQIPGYYRLEIKVELPSETLFEFTHILKVIEDEPEEPVWEAEEPDNGTQEEFDDWEYQMGGSYSAGGDTNKHLDDDPTPVSRDGEPESIPQPRFINATFIEHDTNQPLQKGEIYNLAFGVDTTQGEASVAIDEEHTFAPGEEWVDLDVVLVSWDFKIHTPQALKLRVPRKGKSRSRAIFQIEPLPSAGKTGVISVYFQKENNYIQGMKLTVNIGGENRPAIASVETNGRPKHGAFAVGRRDVSLKIEQNNDHFTIQMTDNGNFNGVLQIPVPELDSIITEARATLREVLELEDSNGKRPYRSAIQIPEEVHRKGLHCLAKAGWDLFQRIFVDQPDEGAQKIGNRLRELVNHTGLKIQIVSGQFMLPWGMLYLAPKFPKTEDEVDACYFLGFRHIIEHIPATLKAVPVKNAITSKPELSVSINMNARLDLPNLPLTRQQKDAWANLEPRGVRLRVGESWDELLEALQEQTSPPQILYFFCHAGTGSLSNINSAFLELSENETVKLLDLRRYAPIHERLAGAPLVFINACESAKISPLYYSGFLTYFTDKGARGLIGTECAIPGVFAAEWAKRFFNRFLIGGEALGDLFLRLRQNFLDENNNLLGLLYAVYCDGDLVVEPGI